MKKLLVIAIAAFAFTACNSSSKPAEGSATDSNAAATEQTTPPTEGTTTAPAEGTAPAPVEGTTTAPAEGTTTAPAEAAPATPAEKH